MSPDRFDDEWEAAKRGEYVEPEPPPGRFDDDEPDPEPLATSNVVPLRATKTMARGSVDTSVEMKPAIKQALVAVQDRVKRNGALAGAPCGLTALDEKLDGFQTERFYVFGGRTGMGKSVVGLNFGMGLARNGYGVDYLSLEMPIAEQALRALLCEARVPEFRVRQGTVQDRHWARLTTAVNEMCKWPWVWDDKGGLTADDVAAHAVRTRERMDAKGQSLHAVIIDHIQKLRGDNPRAPRHEQMKWIVDTLKQMAIREKLCVIALAQISRDTEGRNIKDRRPRMANLREAGAVEEEADVVGLLYRPDYYADKDAERTNVLELNLPKIRGGEPTLVKFRFDGPRTRIDTLAREDWDE